MRRENGISWRLLRKATIQDLSEKEKETFDHWVKDPDHQAFFDQAIDFYHKDQFDEIDTHARFKALMKQVDSTKQRSRWKRIAVAASILLAISISSLKLYHISNQANNHSSSFAWVDVQKPYLILEDGTKVALTDTGHLPKDLFKVSADRLVISDISSQWFVSKKQYSLVVPRKQIFVIQLADGTEVTLNAESKLTFSNIFDQDFRQVTIQGEGFFKVAKEEFRPFLVNTPDIHIKVLGTQFNVNTRSLEQTVIILTEGQVKAVDTKTKQNVFMTSDMLATYNNGSWSTQYNVNTERLLAWRDDSFSYQNNTLKEIFNDLSYWYDFKIHYMDLEIQDKKFTGTFERYDQFQNIVKLFKTMGIDIDYKNGIYEVKTKQ
ncbi:FecR domain-containing protein [Prolixibacteraceae bacterium]|nr:FecR domain-containing protein [Prolixibacteraceae bacterium]